MAGKRHHILWKHIQNGFGTKSGKDHEIWVYRGGSEPRRTVARKNGVENYFYGPEGSIADETITKTENELAEFITEARQARDGELVNPALAATFLTLTEIRSQALQTEIPKIFIPTIAEFRKNFADRARLAKLFQSYIRANPQELRRRTQEAFPDGTLADAVEDVLSPQLNSLIEEASERIAAEFAESFPLDEVDFVELARSSHLEALSNNVKDTQRFNLHQNRTYRVRRFPDEMLILPDTGMMAASGSKKASISTKHMPRAYIVLPISSSSAIVSEGDDLGARPVRIVNKLLAGCALESFVAKRDCLEHSRLMPRIGRNPTFGRPADFARLASLSSVQEMILKRR